MFGLADGTLLWQKRFKNGTAGAGLKALLGSQGRMPTFPPLDPRKRDLHTFPAKDLPRIPGTEKLDVAASLALFNIKDPTVLWAERFRPDSAGGHLKRLLGQRLVSRSRSTGAEESRARHQPEFGEDLRASLPAQPEAQPALKLNEQGRIDISASLLVLGIADPRTLWSGPIQAGSPAHTLKKEIARALVSGITVPGITRSDVGL
jgi:hypothetical protein